MNINKKELIQQLASEFGYTKSSAVALVNDFCEAVRSNLEQGNTVSIHGFGTFDMVSRIERTCKTPQGNDCVVPAHWSPKFIPGNSLKRAVKTWEDNEARGL